MTLRISFKTSPQGVDWPTLDATWRRAGELSADGGPSAFDGAWMNDHLLDMDPSVPGPSLEAVTVLAALAHHVPGLRIGHAVLSNTFRHPVLVAKAATVMDHVTGGRFVLGLGAGWFENEHGPFGIDLPPIGERISRLESAVDTIAAAVRPGRRRRARRHPRRPLLPAQRRDQPARAAHPGRPAAVPRRAGPARDPPRGARGAGLAAPRHRGGRRCVLRGQARPDRPRARGRGPGSRDVRARRPGRHGAGRGRPGTRARAGPRGSSPRARSEIVLGMPAALGPAGLDAVHRDLLPPLRDAAA